MRNYKSYALDYKQILISKFHIAIVVGKEGIRHGLVSLEDLLEEVVWVIHDEYDHIGKN